DRRAVRSKILPHGRDRLLLDRQGRDAVLPVQLVDRGDVGQPRCLKKAGIDKVPATWPDTFPAAANLHTPGYDKCGSSTAWFTWTNVEQFTAWHNIQLSTKANGLDGFDTVLTFNKNPAVVRHFENLARYQKDKTFDYSGRTNEGEGRFTSGEYPLF